MTTDIQAAQLAELTPAVTSELVVQEEAELRPKNQITVPRQVAQALGLHTGDRIVFEIREGERNEVRVRRIRESYAGALAGTYGSAEEAEEYLQAEREAWDE